MKRINEESFNKIKMLSAAGMSIAELTNFTKKARTTITNVVHSTNFNAYKQRLTETSIKYGRQPKKVGVHECIKCGKQCKTANMLTRHYRSCKETAIDMGQPTKPQPTPETPIYDILVKIHNELKTQNEYIRTAGKSKNFRLW